MKVAWMIGWLFFVSVMAPSCQKERERCTATIHVRLNHHSEEIEWMEVTAGRKDINGEIHITATGLADERFLLNLQHVNDTGTIPNLTILQLSCSDGLGFSAQGIQAGFVQIKERSARFLSGSFVVSFNTGHAAARPVKAEGEFTIYGHD